MSVFSRLRDTQVSPRTAGICIGVLAIVCTFAVIAVRNGAAGGAESRPAAKAAHTSVQVKPMVARTAASVAKDPKETSVAAPNADDVCQIIADRNIFKPVSAASQSSSSSPLPPMPVGRLPVLPGMMGGQFGGGGSAKGLAFTGVVETPNGRMALIENTSTGETRYAYQGERVFGANLVNISARTVSLDAGGGMVSLALGENKSDTTPGAAAATPPTAAPAAQTPPAAAPSTPPDQPQPFGGGNFQGRRGRRRGGQPGGAPGQ